MKEALTGQFKRALHMFSRGMGKFSETDWRLGETPDRRPAAQVYHVVESIDFYAGELPSEQFPWGQRFGVDWECEDPALLPSQLQMKEYLEEVEGKLAGWMVTVDLSAPELLFRWTGRTGLERVLYSLRHLQQHIGELSRELDFRGQEGPNWR